MIQCTNLKCKYRNDKGKCTCKNVNLTFWNVATFNMGNKDFLECKSFKEDREYLRLKETIGDKLKVEWFEESILDKGEE